MTPFSNEYKKLTTLKLDIRVVQDYEGLEVWTVQYVLCQMGSLTRLNPLRQCGILMSITH